MPKRSLTINDVGKALKSVSPRSQGERTGVRVRTGVTGPASGLTPTPHWKEIAQHLKIHYTTVSKAVKEVEEEK